MAAPITMFVNRHDYVVAIILISVYCFHTLLTVDGHKASKSEGFFLCRKCGFEVGQSEDILILPTRTYFEVITTRSATVQKANDKHAADTWFPGYVWSLIFCPRCGNHLGWWFDAMTESLDNLPLKVTSFVGFILDKIMHEDEESNLIAVPKSFMS